MIFKCKFCDREMKNATALSYRSNQYCNLCFNDRADFYIGKVDFKGTTPKESENDIIEYFKNFRLE